jgi:LAO/AO transport system kinase
LGDDIQAIKAGILEIADVFAVNKADLEGVDRAVMSLRMMLDLSSGGARTVMHHGRVMEVVVAASDGKVQGNGEFQEMVWQPPIQKTVATRREGIPELAGAILAHRDHLERTGGLAMRERERAAAELETIIQQESLRMVLERTDRSQVAEYVEQIVARELDPYSACQRLVSP